MLGGRLKKHSTAEAKAAAKRKHNHEEYLRRKSRSFILETRSDFVHYAPALPGVLSATPSDIGLRISADIPIPRDPLVQLDEDKQDAIRPPSRLAPLPEDDVVEDDVEAARVIRQPKASDGQHATECNTYKRRIQQQMSETDARAAEILFEMQTGITQPHVSANKIPEHLGDVQRSAELDCESPRSAASQNQTAGNSNLQRSSVMLVVEETVVAEESPTANTCSISRALTPTLREATNSPTEAIESLQARSQRSSVSSARSGRRDDRR